MFALISKKRKYVECLVEDKNICENYLDNLKNKERYMLIETPNNDYPVYIVYGKNMKTMNDEEFSKFIILLKQSKENMFGNCLEGVDLFDKENSKNKENFQKYCTVIKINKEQCIGYCNLCKWELNHLNGDINKLFLFD